MPKTKGEKYELFEKVSIQGSESFDPKQVLAPNTEVDILQEDAAFCKQEYSYVEVMDGVHKGSFGYVVQFALLECDVLQSKVGLKSVATTGVKYGGGGTPKGDTRGTGFGVGKMELNFELPFSGKEGCPYCGGTIDKHQVEESKEAKALAEAVHQGIRTSASPPPSGTKFMIGILIVEGAKGKKLLAVSNGFPKDKSYNDTLAAVAKTNGLNLIEPSDVQQWDKLRDFTGKSIGTLGSGKEKVNIKNVKDEFLVCAGPKLIQQVLQCYQSDEINFTGKLYMSEIWYEQKDKHANYGDKGTAESCPKCAVMIPRMLCGYKPKK